MVGWFKKTGDNPSATQEAYTILIDKQGLLSALNLVYSVAAASTVDILRGSLFRIKGNKLTLVATDGRRLVLVENDLLSSNVQQKDIFVPFQTLEEIKQYCASADYSKISLIIKNKEISFESGGSHRIGDASQFPRYKQVILPASGNKTNLDCSRFLWALKEIKQFADPKIPKIRLEIAEKQLIISTPDLKYRQALSVDYQGPRFIMAFDANLLADVLEKLPSGNEMISLEFYGHDKPITIRGKNYMCILLPMKL